MALGATLGKVIRFAIGFVNPARYVPVSVPRLSIETTNICNSKCIFCANPLMKRRKEPLSMELFRKVIDDFASSGGTLVDFNTVIGDPLLDPHLLERGRYVRTFSQFKSLGFVTTLQWLHRWKVEEILRVFNWMEVSLTLSGRESYRRFFGVDLYDQMLTNLEHLLKCNNELGGITHVGFSIKPTEDAEAVILNHPDFKKIMSLTSQDLVAAVRAGKQGYVDDWLGSVSLPSHLKQRPLIPRAFRPCGLLYHALMVYSNGKIGACACRDFNADSELILGHASEISIMTAWKGEKLSNIRNQWRRWNQVPPSCKRCRHYLY